MEVFHYAGGQPKHLGIPYFAYVRSDKMGEDPETVHATGNRMKKKIGQDTPQDLKMKLNTCKKRKRAAIRTS